MAWQCEYLGLTKEGMNLVPKVKFTETVSGETFTRDFRANDITLDGMKRFCAEQLRLLDQKDRAEATFTGFPLGVFDPRK